MCREGNQINRNVPEDADKILFAEDIVNYILNQFLLPSLSSGIETSRPLIYNAFNETVRVATNIMFRRLETEVSKEFSDIRAENALDGNAFMSYVTSMEHEYLSQGFNAQNLLHFCVKTTTMAVKFYYNGFDEGPVRAVQCIIHILEDYDMASSGWHEVDVVASNYTTMYGDLDDVLTSDSHSDSEYESTSVHTSDLVDTESSDSVNAAVQDTNEDVQKIADSAAAAEVSSNASGSASMPAEEYVAGGTRSQQNEFLDSAAELEFSGVPEDECSMISVVHTSEDDAERNGSDDSISTTKVNESKDLDSDVFEESATEINRGDLYGRQAAKKRSASSSSSVTDISVSIPMQQSDNSLTSLVASTTNKSPNTSSSESECSAGTSNIKISPICKHASKKRK